jgi:hypothetical protein
LASFAPLAAMGVTAALGLPLYILPLAAITTGGILGSAIKHDTYVVDNDCIKKEEARANLRKSAAILAFDDPEKITPQDLRRHYRYLSRQYHSDRHSRAPENIQLSCENNFLNVQKAYNNLRKHLMITNKWDNTAEVEHERQKQEYY